MPVPDRCEPVGRHLLRDTAYAKLSDAIISGMLAPGEALNDAQLCGWLGLSRTPVREALSRLSDEGLVEMEPQRYTRVAAMAATDLHEIVPLLAILHGLATELAVPRLATEDVERLHVHNEGFVAGLRAGDRMAAYEQDECFHSVFVAACGNPELPRVLARLTPRLRRLECIGPGNLPGQRSVAQHEAIVSRAQLGDAPGAAAATRANWMTLGGVIERGFARGN